MKRIEYECTLAGELVRVSTERIIYNDHDLHAKRSMDALIFCSHQGTRNCRVRKANAPESDVEGMPYSGTDKCAYLAMLIQKTHTLPNKGCHE